MKDKTVQIRLSAMEFEKLEEKCGVMGVSKSEFIRRAIHGDIGGEVDCNDKRNDNVITGEEDVITGSTERKESGAISKKDQTVWKKIKKEKKIKY